MRLPLWVSVFGYLGLLPFLVVPAWPLLSSYALPAAVEQAWHLYIALVAAFLCGSFWGFALPAAMGPAGAIGMAIASLLMLFTWGALLLQLRASLLALGAVYLLLLAADFWRERTLDTLPGYFVLRAVLTVGALLAIGTQVARL